MWSRKGTAACRQRCGDCRFRSRVVSGPSRKCKVVQVWYWSGSVSSRYGSRRCILRCTDQLDCDSNRRSGLPLNGQAQIVPVVAQTRPTPPPTPRKAKEEKTLMELWERKNDRPKKMCGKYLRSHINILMASTGVLWWRYCYDIVRPPEIIRPLNFEFMCLFLVDFIGGRLYYGLLLSGLFVNG